MLPSVTCPLALPAPGDSGVSRYNLAMSTRFVYITDTHLGARPDTGYVQQPRYADRLDELLGLLDSWIERQDREIAFVLHGGDMVDQASRALVCAARETFSLQVPVYLSLGNHDLTAPDALSLWTTHAPSFFLEDGPAFRLRGNGWMLHTLPTQWCATPYYWHDEQLPHLLPEHLADLEARLVRHSDLVHVLCTHGEVLAVPAEQVGRAEPYHPPLAAFSETVRDLSLRYPQLRTILSGHNHINTCGPIGCAYAITGSAFTETPFEFKVIEIDRGGLTIETVPLVSSVSFRALYDWDRTFVQGRRCDRALRTRGTQDRPMPGG